MNVVKQYGLERSGTNLIKALIEINCPDTMVLASMYGAKHNKYEPVDIDTYDPRTDDKIICDPLTDDQVRSLKSAFRNKEVFYIISIKNPFSWVVSFRRYYERHCLEYPDIYDLIDKWNEYNKDWINLVYRNYSRGFLIEFEDFIFNTELMMLKIANKFCITINDNFQHIDNLMIEGVDVHGSKNIGPEKFSEVEFYKNKEYMNLLSSHDIDVINMKADFNIMADCRDFFH